MDISSVSSIGANKRPSSEPQDLKNKKIALDGEQLLRAIASWIACNNLSATKKVMFEWHSFRSTASASRYQSSINKPLQPLLVLASKTKNDVTQADEVVQTILHIFLLHYVLETNDVKNMENDVRLIKFLCEMGASVIAEDQYNNTPLGLALEKHRIDLVEAMVEFSTSNVNDNNNRGDTILHVLLGKYRYNKSETYTKFLDTIYRVISNGANVNQPNHEGQLPVHLTARSIHSQVLEKLISHRMDLHYRIEDGDNLLILMCKGINCANQQLNLKMISWLLKQGCDLNAKNNEGLTPLYYVTQFNDVVTMKILIEAGADEHFVIPNGTNLLHLATARTCFDAMYYLIDRGLPFNRRNIVHGAILMYMLAQFERDNENVVRWLIKHGFDRSEKGDLTMLHLAAMLGYAKIVIKLIERGANVHARDESFQYTALHLASIRRQFATVPELKKVGLRYGRIYIYSAGFGCITDSGEFGLSGHTDRIDYESTVLALLKAGADINAKDRSGRTSLHYAARHEDVNDLIVLLLKAGANLEVLDSEQLSPLHCSLLKYNERGLMHLLSFGADINDIEHPSRHISSAIIAFHLLGSGVRKYLMKLNVAGLYINHLYRPYIEYKNHQEDCVKFLEELKKMKTRMIASNVSLYKWLHMKTNRRFTLIDSLPPNIESEFQHYGTVIQSLRYQAINRKPLLEAAKISFQYLTAWQWPDICAEHVLSFLDNNTLKVIIDMHDKF